MRTRTSRLLGLLAALALAASGLVTTSAAAAERDRPAASEPEPATPKAAQTLTWTADNSTTAYKEAPTEAVAGPTTIVFENSRATGNTSGMQHTLTFDTSTAGYNHDVDVDILAYPGDAQDGRWEVEVVLTEGTYGFICTIPGHGQMKGELVVTGGGEPGDDTTPPEVSASIDGDTDDAGAYVGSATVSLTATDDSSGVESIEYQLDDTGWQAYTEPVEVTEIGDHTIGYRATDVAGNVSEEGNDPFTIVEDDGPDETPPEVEAMLHGDTNADGAYLGAAEVMLTATDARSEIESIEYQVDGGEWQAYAEPFAVEGVGDHVVGYRATDTAGNTSEPGSVEFTVVQAPDDDTDPPTVSATVTGEQDGSWAYVGSATLTLAAADDGSGVASVEYRLGDDDWQAYEEPVVVEDEGDHVVGYRATDTAGNVSEAGETSFSVAGAPSTPRCRVPDPSPTVVIGDVGTGVRNRSAGGGCTIDDLIQDEARWATHAAFLAHARRVLTGLRQDGVVSATEHDAILAAAQRAHIGDDR